MLGQRRIAAFSRPLAQQFVDARRLPRTLLRLQELDRPYIIAGRLGDAGGPGPVGDAGGRVPQDR